MKKYIIFLFILSSITFSNPISSGLGEKFSTIDGVDAIASNPAGVAKGDTSLALNIRGEIGLQNNLISFNEYISESDKKDLFENIEENGWIINQNANAGIDLKIGKLTITTSGKTDINASLSEDMGKILLEGSEIGKSYTLDGSKASLLAYGDFGLNFSKDFSNNTTIGITYHYLTGSIGKFEANGIDMVIDYYEDDTEGPKITSDGGDFLYTYSDPEEGLATGHSFDIGIYKEMDSFDLAFSVMNIGKLTAESGTVKQQKQIMQFDEEGDVDGFEEGEEFTLYEDVSISLPLIYNLGISKNILPSIKGLLGYKYTKYDEFIDVSDNKFSAGVEIDKLKIIPIRLGVNYSTLTDSMGWSFGTGLHLFFLKTDFGVTQSEKDVNLGLSTRIEF